MITKGKKMNLAFITIKTPTSISLERATLMVQSKLKMLSTNFEITFNAFVHSASYSGWVSTLEVELTMCSELQMAAYVLLTNAVSKKLVPPDKSLSR